jgi:hypothetical protein
MPRRPFDIEQWKRQCIEALVTGRLADLENFLNDPLPPPYDVLVTFYRGRLTLAHHDYSGAVSIFHDAATRAKSANLLDLHHHSLIWLAYTHTILGNYSLAQSLLKGVEQNISPENPIYAELVFVQGLIAGDSSSRADAQEYLERARDLALLHNDTILEARCCANLAPIYNTMGFVSRSLRAIDRVIEINHQGLINPQQMAQAQNTRFHCLRFLGRLDEALKDAYPLPELVDDGSRHFRGWMALSIASVAVDADNFVLAEEAWHRAHDILIGNTPIKDNHLTAAELHWERAWFLYRQNRLSEASYEINAAVDLIDSSSDVARRDSYVIKAVIDLALGDRGLVSHFLSTACDGFRKEKHPLGLASALLHVASFHLRSRRAFEGRKTLAEAFGLLRRHRLYGTYYWDSRLMVELCLLVMQEDWGEYEEALDIRQLSTDEGPIPADIYGLDSFAKEELGDFATTLACQRLARSHWQAFELLLADERSHIRLRGAQVLLNSKSPEALELLDPLVDDPIPAVRSWYYQHVAPLMEGPESAPPLHVRSFERYEILHHGKPWRVRTTGGRRAKALLGILLICGERGMRRDDLMAFLWPIHDKDKQRGSLQVAIAALRRLLEETVGETVKIQFRDDVQRYALNCAEPPLWWDWAHLRHLARDGNVRCSSLDRKEQVIALCQARLVEEGYQTSFMEDFFDLCPRPDGQNEDIQHRWNSACEDIHEILARHHADAEEWVREILGAESDDEKVS